MVDGRVRDQAWIGDAVLALYARMWALRNVRDASLRSAVFTHFTSNHSLAAIGDPTRVEAQIGDAFAAGGLQSGFDFISLKLLPVFVAQWNKKVKAQRGPQISAGETPTAP